MYVDEKEDEGVEFDEADGVMVTAMEMDDEDAASAEETFATTVDVGIIGDMDEAMSVETAIDVSAPPAPRLLPAPDDASDATAGPGWPRASRPTAADRKGIKPCGMVAVA